MGINRFKSWISRNLQYFFIFFIIVILIIFSSLFGFGISSTAGLRNVLIQGGILAIVAAGETIAIILGGIDLSVPWVITGAAMVTSSLAQGQNERLIWVIPFVLALGASVGIFNGIGIGFLNIPPIIMTLSTNVILTGLVLLVFGVAIPTYPPDILVFLAHGNVWKIPMIVFILLGVITFMTLILSYTPFGRRIYAVGTSPMVSIYSGIKPPDILVPAYALSSVAASIAGIMYLGYVDMAYPGMGDKFLFIAISSVIVGGASILGGSGHYLGTVAGAILITIVNMILLVLNIGAGAINIFYGLIILFSVWIVSLRANVRQVS